MIHDQEKHHLQKQTRNDREERISSDFKRGIMSTFKDLKENMNLMNKQGITVE